MRTNILKGLFATVAIAISALSAQAQADQILLHNGKVITGKVYKIAENTVMFAYENEDAEQTLGKYAVEKITYGKSGRVQEVSERIVIHSKDDWQKVIVIDNTNEVAGLNRKGEVKGKTAFINYRTGEGSDKTALKKLKMDAAAMGCAFVHITTDKDIDRKSDDGGSFGQVQSIKKGIGYSYN